MVAPTLDNGKTIKEREKEPSQPSPENFITVTLPTTKDQEKDPKNIPMGTYMKVTGKMIKGREKG